jgi:hypothetical protein
MDPIEMPSYLGYHYILMVIDPFSNYGFVGKLKHRNGEEMGNGLVHILSSRMIPDVLQSNNGREVSDLSKFFLVFLNQLSPFWYIIILLNICPHIWSTLHFLNIA